MTTKWEPTIVKTPKRVESQCRQFLDTGSIPVASTKIKFYVKGVACYANISFCDLLYFSSDKFYCFNLLRYRSTCNKHSTFKLYP